VVLSAIRVIMRYLDYLNNAELIRNYCKKLADPLISLTGLDSEIVYIALKNINIMLQKRPTIFDK
jgi:vesicle coat complex subunit